MTSRKMASINSSTPPLRAQGCDFFGSPENKNPCSKCYEDYLKEEVTANSANKLSEPVITPSADCKSPAVASDEARSTTNTAASSSTRNIRCECCNEKVGVTGCNCLCGKIICGIHRNAAEHPWTFDFKTLGR
ncbi:hypothetical protein POTOM_050933 [Populus tomentosa]|uniref:A20-type domain-containing protein n=1 Tax=Populus tomentosa TaxID=118781 RepID=A0A8X7Y4L7_POPTO|nr:hypothetical protein POTOM_050933 [Populus tomentosa]